MSEPSEPGNQATPANKPRLKINVSRTNSMIQEAGATPGSAAPVQTPIAQTPGGDGHRKVKLKINSSVPPTPANENGPNATKGASTTAVTAGPQPTPVKTKAGRQPKPTQRLIESKKRARDDEDDDDENRPLASAKRQASGSGPTRIKIRPTLKSAPTQLVVKPRGRPPHHPPGDGYDSEGSEREIDPAIEEQFVLRMIPGEHCDYMRWCMENGKMGVPKSQGGADVQLRFFEEDSRRAAVTVKGQVHAAVMVDLPTITEAMKTWDRKQFMKSADICQMLLVFAKVKDEQEARRAELPKMLDQKTFKWPHGLTPPMHDCVNRRFAKTISRKEIEDKEAEVERLLQEDAKANSTKWEWVDEQQEDMDEDEGADEDAEGEVDESVDYFGDSQVAYGDQEGDVVSDDELEADLEAALMAGQTPGGMDAATPVADATSAAGTAAKAAGVQPSIEMDSGADGVSEEDDEDDDDDDDDEDDEDLDDDQRAERDEHHAVLSMIKDLEKQMASKSAELAKMPNKILRARIEQQVKQLKSEIDLKKSSIGLDADD